MSLIEYVNFPVLNNFDNVFDANPFAFAIEHNQLMPKKMRREMNQLMNVAKMNIDFVEHDKEYTLHADLPGFKKEDIQMTIDNGVLHMEANKEETTEKGKGKHHYKERTWGKIQRSFRLPGNADKEHVNVSYTDGVLNLTFPKVEVSTSKKLIIN